MDLRILIIKIIIKHILILTENLQVTQDKSLKKLGEFLN